MNHSEVRDTTYWLLIQVAIRARHDFARLAEKKHGLSWPQMHTLCLIQPGRPVAMNLISCQMGCDASNVTGIVDRLTAQGYVTRTDSSTDRRIKIITLTKRGQVLRGQLLKDIATSGARYMSALDASERERFHELLAKAMSNTPIFDWYSSPRTK